VNVLQQAVGKGNQGSISGNITSISKPVNATGGSATQCITLDFGTGSSSSQWGTVLQYAGLFYYLFIAVYKRYVCLDTYTLLIHLC